MPRIPQVLTTGMSLLTISCTVSGSGEQTRQPEAVPPSRKVADPAEPGRGSITSFQHRSGTYQYLLVTDAVIRQLPDTATPPQQQTSTRAYISLTFGPQGTTLSGSLDSITIRRQHGIPLPNDSLPHLPLRWTEQSTDSSSCSITAELIHIGTTIIPPIPQQFRLGSRWSDSTTRVVCRVGTHLILQSTHDYEAIGPSMFQGDSAYQILRRSTITLSSLSTDSISTSPRISGSGSGTSEFYLDINTQLLIAQSSEGTLTISISSNQDTTRLRQDLRAQTTLLTSRSP